MLKLDSPLTTGLDKKDFNTDFKKWLYAEEILYSNLDFQEQIELISVVTGAEPIEMLSFLKCGNEVELNTNEAEKEVEPRPYSYIYDWQLIYSAFFEQYGIDLLSEAGLHYWKFKALFNGLHDTLFNKVIEFRTIDLAAIKDKETRNYYAKMKKEFELPSERERRKKILEEFNKL